MNGSLVKNREGKIVGRIENKIFIKEVYGHTHMLRQPIAWAIDADIFDRVIVPLCYSIHILDKDTGAWYKCGVKTFNEKKQILDRGHARQYYMELVNWVV